MVVILISLAVIAVTFVYLLCHLEKYEDIDDMPVMGRLAVFLNLMGVCTFSLFAVQGPEWLYTLITVAILGFEYLLLEKLLA